MKTTLLLAPNGKASNLNETQYKLVRTQVFKDWFGDWEKAPLDSSKVIDENGEPLVVYHGTNADFDSFSEEAERKGYSHNGFFFTPNIIQAESYTFKGFSNPENIKKGTAYDENANIMPVFLDIKNPLFIDSKSRRFSDIGAEEYKYSKDFTVNVKDLRIQYIDWDKLWHIRDSKLGGSHFKFKTEPEAKKKLAELKKEKKSFPATVEFVNTRGGKHINEYISDLMVSDNDGAIFKNINDMGSSVSEAYDVSEIGETIWVKNANQIKSAIANNGDFNPKKDSILLNNGGKIAIGLASNGNTSNLNEIQYKLVRTPEFKAWFGDWENNPELSSKVIDENGEPLVVYHGSDDDFNKFIPNKNVFTRQQGFYFSSNENVSKKYGNIVKSYFINLKDVITYDAEDSSFSEVIEEFPELENDLMQQGFAIDGVIINNVYDAPNGNKIGEKANTYCVYDSHNIKLANGKNTTFDSSNEDIRYEEGGSIIKTDMKENEEIVTLDKVKNTPAGGVLIGKSKEGQTIIPEDGTMGGFLVGRLHKENGIKAVNKSNGQPLEMQGNEVVITAPAVADQSKREFEGQMMTNRQILSKINSDGGGVSFADGGEIPAKIHVSDKQYNFDGNNEDDIQIVRKLGHNATLKNGGQLFSFFEKTYDINEAYKLINSGEIMFDVKEVDTFPVHYRSFNEKYSKELNPDFSVAQGLMIKYDNGKDLLIDGNHRMNNAYINGIKKIKVYYIDNPKIISKFSKKSSFAEGGKLSVLGDGKAKANTKKYNEIYFYELPEIEKILESGEENNLYIRSWRRKELEKQKQKLEKQLEILETKISRDEFEKYLRPNMCCSWWDFADLQEPDNDDYEYKEGGHLSKGKSLEEIAEMHDVSLYHIMQQIALGLEVEKEHTSDENERINIAKDHLVENPDYYTILDKAGLEKGGTVDLVKSSKRGDTPARDLNNYNDVIDLQEDGIVGNHQDFSNADASSVGISFADGGEIPKGSKFTFMQNSPMQRARALTALAGLVRYDGKVYKFYELIESLPKGLEISTSKIHSSKSEKGYTEKMTIGNMIINYKAEADYYTYLDNGGYSYSEFLKDEAIQKEIQDKADKIQREKDNEEKRIKDEESRKKSEIAKKAQIKALIEKGADALIEEMNAPRIKLIESHKQERQTQSVKDEIDYHTRMVEQLDRQLKEQYIIATQLYKIVDGEVYPKFIWKVGDDVIVDGFINHEPAKIETEIEEIKDNFNNGNLSYKVAPAEGINNRWIGYDGLFPVKDAFRQSIEEDEENFEKLYAENQEKEAIIKKIIKEKYNKNFEAKYIGMYSSDGWFGEAKHLWNTPLNKLRERITKEKESKTEPENQITKGYFIVDSENTAYEYAKMINDYFNVFNAMKNEQDLENFKKLQVPWFGTYENQTILHQIERYEKIGLTLGSNEVVRNDFKKAVAKILNEKLNEKRTYNQSVEDFEKQNPNLKFLTRVHKLLSVDANIPYYEKMGYVLTFKKEDNGDTLIYGEKTNNEMKKDLKEESEEIGSKKQKSFESEGSKEGKGKLYEFFTPQIVADKMVALAQHYGFTGGNVLEPACGNGRLIKNLKDCNITAFEISKENYKMLESEFPNSDLHNYNFEKAFLKAPRFNALLNRKGTETWLKNAPFDLVIANPPYGKFSGLYASYFNFKGQVEHFFILQSLYLLKKGGLGVFLIPSSFLRNGIAYNEIKQKMFEEAEFVDAYRMPSNLFEKTDIGTDILILRKK